MEITLYRNCILTNSYSEVFHSSVFGNYLNSLPHITVPDTDYVYQRNEGVFTFDLSYLQQGTYYSIYQYNYLKFESDDESGAIPFIRYAFITNIELANGVALISYAEDLWHSYSSSINIRESLLTKSKLLKYGQNDVKIFKNPIDYITNKKLDIEELDSAVAIHKYSIFAQCQKSTTGAWGTSTNRQVENILIYRLSGTSGANQTFTREFTMAECQDIINEMIVLQSKEIIDGGTTIKWITPTTINAYCSIDNIVIVPSSLLKSIPFSNDYAFGTKTVAYQDVEQTIPNGMQCLSWYVKSNTQRILYMTPSKTFNNYYHSFRLLKSYQVDNNFKNMTIGTFSHQYELVNNGMEKTIGVYQFITNYDYKMYLQFDGQIYDITEDYTVEVPFYAVDGEIQTQRNAQRIQKTLSGALETGVGLIKTMIGVGSYSGDISNASKLTELGNMYYKTPKTNKITKSRKNLKTAIGYYSQANALEESASAGLLSSSSTGIGNMVNGISNIIISNMSAYSSNTATGQTSNAFLNARYNICIKQVNSDNDTEIAQYINNCGYDCWYLGGNEILENKTGTGNEYDILKFDYLKLYGDFPQDIGTALKNILLNGFKIYHTSTI